jgi:low affinity Fe/Cu permease
LDELLRTTKGARQDVIGLEDLSADQLADMHRKYKALSRATRKLLLKSNDENEEPFEFND